MKHVTTLYLVRHGQTDHNKNEINQGWLDSPLNDHGRAQARALAARMQSVELDHILASPLSRADETARILAAANGAPLRYVDDLKEINMGAFTGMNFRDAEALRSPSFATHAGQYVPPAGGESPQEMFDRSRVFLEMVLQDMQHKRVLAISHGGLIITMIMAALQLNPHARLRAGVQNASISKLEHIGDRWRLCLLNDHGHRQLLGEDTL